MLHAVQGHRRESMRPQERDSRCPCSVVYLRQTGNVLAAIFSSPGTAIGRVFVSGVTMGWLLRLVTGGPTGGRGPPTVLEFLVITYITLCIGSFAFC